MEYRVQSILIYILAGVGVAAILGHLKDLLFPKKKKASTRSFKMSMTGGNTTIRKAYTVGGRVKPKYNTDDKAYKAEQDEVKKGIDHG